MLTWRIPKIGYQVPPNHSFIDRCSIINHPVWVSPILRNPQIKLFGIVTPTNHDFTCPTKLCALAQRSPVLIGAGKRSSVRLSDAAVLFFVVAGQGGA